MNLIDQAYTNHWTALAQQRLQVFVQNQNIALKLESEDWKRIGYMHIYRVN